LPASRRKFPEGLTRPIEAGAAPEFTAISIELAAVGAPTGAWRSLGFGARSGDLGNIPVGVAVEFVGERR